MCQYFRFKLLDRDSHLIASYEFILKRYRLLSIMIYLWSINVVELYDTYTISCFITDDRLMYHIDLVLYCTDES
jgi:hypothetical protein